MSAPASADSASRRDLLRGSSTTVVGAVGTGAAILLAGCGKTSSRPQVTKVPASDRGPDVVLLNQILDLEHMTIAAYTAGIPLLNGAGQMAAKHFLDQELTHAGELSGLIKQAGGKGREPRPSYDLGHPRSATDVLALLHRLESAQLAAYVNALPQLSPGSVRSAVAAVLGNDAQHVSILRSVLGLEPVQAPFVTGRE